MSELEKTKFNIINNIHKLCAHCVNQVQHDCPVQIIARQVEAISGVPLIVNAEFKGVLFR